MFTISQIVRGYFQSAYLGYYASARHAGKGLMAESMLLVLDHAFGPLALHRLEANIQPGNAPSVALARGAGFRLEGYSPRYLLIGGRWRDHERYAITADEHVQNRRRRQPARRPRTGRAGPSSGSRLRRDLGDDLGLGHDELGLGRRGLLRRGQREQLRDAAEVGAQDLEHRRRVERRGRVVERVEPYRARARSGGSPRARAGA